MSKAGYSASTGAAVALVAATAKTVLNVIAPATFGVDLQKIRIAFDGTNSASVPVLVELCYSTVIDSYLVSPFGGTVIYDYPLGTTPDTAVSNGLALRITAPAVVNVRATMYFERC